MAGILLRAQAETRSFHLGSRRTYSRLCRDSSLSAQHYQRINLLRVSPPIHLAGSLLRRRRTGLSGGFGRRTERCLCRVHVTAQIIQVFDFIFDLLLQAVGTITLSIS